MNSTYSDASAFGKRSYRIEDGVIFVQGATITGSSFESRIKVEHLDPNYDRLRLRSPLLVPLATFALIGIVGSSVLGELSPSKNMTFAYYFCLALGGFGIVFGLLSLRRITVARFKNLSGVASLDIFEAGPNKAEYQKFLSSLQEEIKRSKTD